MERAGAHAKGYNKYSIGICLIGGVDINGTPVANYDKQQWAMLKDLVLNLIARFNPTIIQGHRDINPQKECPCFDVEAWLENEEIWEN